MRPLSTLGRALALALLGHWASAQSTPSIASTVGTASASAPPSGTAAPTRGMSTATLAAIGGVVGALLLAGIVGGACVIGIACCADPPSYFRRKQMRAMLDDVRGRPVRVALRPSLISQRRPSLLPTIQTSNSGVSLPSATGPAVPSRRDRRYNRRHDSGASVRSVPTYRPEAADTELVLARSSVKDEGEDLDEVSLVPISRALSSPDIPPHSPPPSSSGHGPLLEPPQYTSHSGRPRSSSAPADPEDTLLTSLPPIERTTTAPATNHRVSHARTRSAHALSNAKAPVSRSARIRSAIYGGGSGPAAQSSTSLLLRSTSGRGRSASASSTSLIISAPLEGSFMRTSFTYPSKGLSEAQASFIASRESLTQHGLGGWSTPREPPAFVDAELALPPGAVHGRPSMDGGAADAGEA